MAQIADVSNGNRTAVRLAALAAILLALAGCEVSLGYGLPRTTACRIASTQPGQPISTDCLDSVGHASE